LLVNAGTFACTRTRTHFRNTFKIIDIDENEIKVDVIDIGKEKQNKMIEFNLDDCVCKNKYYD